MAYNKMYFAHAIEILTGLKAMIDFECADFGDGNPVITFWPEGVPQPTQEEIESVDTDAALRPKATSISDRQFFQQLAIAGIITTTEALAAVKTGEIPAAIATIIGALPEEQQFGAEMILSGATTFERNHPMTVFIGTTYGWTDEQVDAFFEAASAL